MPMRAVIFDIGGVLLLTVDHSPHTIWEKRLGLNDGEIFNIASLMGLEPAATLGHITEEQLFKQIAIEKELDEETLRQLRDDFWSLEAVDVELVSFLRSLRPRYKTALLSNAWSDARSGVNNKFKIDELFDGGFFSYEEGLAKPDERMYSLVLDLLNVRPEETVFLDDNLANIEGASKPSIHAIQFENTVQTKMDVRNHL